MIGVVVVVVAAERDAEQPRDAESTAAAHVAQMEDAPSGDDEQIQQQQHRFNELKEAIAEEEEEETGHGAEAAEKQVRVAFIADILMYVT